MIGFPQEKTPRPLAREQIWPLYFSYAHDGQEIKATARRLQASYALLSCESNGRDWPGKCSWSPLLVFSSCQRAFFLNAGETAEDMQTLTSGAAAAFSAGLLRRRRHAQPATACLPRGMLSGSRDV